MFDSIIIFLQTTIVPLGALGVFLGAVLEEVIAPIPSAAVLFTAGFLFLKGLTGVSFFITLIFYIAIPAAAGIAIGALVVYGFAYALGKPFIERWGKMLGITWKDIRLIEDRLEQGAKGSTLLFSLRAIPVIPNVAISAFFGLIRMPWSTFMLASFLGTTIRATILAYVGYHLGGILESLAQVLSFSETLITGVIVGVTLFFLYTHFKNRRKAKNT